MVRNFPAFAAIVAAAFQQVASDPNIFTTGASGDSLYEEYLSAFPEGTNPTFKVRTEHDCTCCRSFIRRVGNVVAITPDYKIRTIWDEAAQSAPEPYNVVAAKLRDKVRASAIVGLFRVAMNEASFGVKSSRSLDPISLVAHTWDHFYTGEIPRQLRSSTVGKTIGDFGTTVSVFRRGLDELNPGAIQTVLDLINANNLYRGEEHKAALVAFQKAQKSYLALSPEERSVFVWARAGDPAARFRNTVLGTLVTDMSAGMELEAAVSSYEAKVAPGNYMRTTALVTPARIENAMKVIAELGLEPALERRLARIEDVSVNDVLWVDGDARPKMKGGLGDVLLAHAKRSSPAVVNENNTTSITLAEFMSTVLPGAKGMELLFKNEHVGNLMALTAPVHPEPARLFRWDNDFAWSYAGNVTDSIKERVKKAGGRVEGATLRVSLSWSNFDDLDLHVHEPPGRGVRAVMSHIFFASRSGWTGGTLDVDMNAGGPRSREPVENVVWTTAVPDGAYRIVVNNYTQRETHDVGFVVEVECGGKITHFTYNKALRTAQSVNVASLHMKNGAIERIDGVDSAISSANIKQTKWGLTTETFVKVNTVTLSPNFWNGSAVGNKHVFFVLDGCAADEELRGIYNEFLHPRLQEHRKVFELIGDKTKCSPTPGQLAGLGFSSTKESFFVIRVRTEKTVRTYNVSIS